MIKDPIPALKRALADELVALAGQGNFFVAARAFGIDPSRLSDLRRGRCARFSVERLVRMLAAVDRSVDVSVTPDSSTPVPWLALARERRTRWIDATRTAR